MRLWSLHPCYLDARGLVALWREALLAQRVLAGATRGYRRHPQLERFLAVPDPSGVIAAYLAAVGDEGDTRGYRFDRTRIIAAPSEDRMDVTMGQLAFEWRHLTRKLEVRSPDRAAVQHETGILLPHPLFRLVEGGVAPWERGMTE